MTLLCVGMLVMACATDTQSERLGRAVQAFTVDIPTSDRCNQGQGPMKCWYVPPVLGTTLYDRMAIDGVASPDEWGNATGLAYSDHKVKANGTILLRAAQYTDSQLPPVDRRKSNGLYVYLDDIPQDPVRPRPFVFFIDHNRFSSDTQKAGPEDRVYKVNLMGTPFKQAYRTNPIDGDQGGVELVPITERFEFSLVSCNMATNEGIYRCSAELWLPLGPKDYDAPGPALLPGIGFAALAESLAGSTPEDMAIENLLPNGTATTMMDPDRPAIIMGDFNIDGATLNLKGKNEYQGLLQTLEIGPSDSSCKMVDDIITPWPADWDWDIDHGDVARERAGIDWYEGRYAGTDIGAGQVPSLEANTCTLTDESFREVRQAGRVEVRV